MKNIAKESIKAVYGSIDPRKLDNSFEVKFIFYLGLIYFKCLIFLISLKKKINKFNF